ncbi:cytochrome c family protein [Aestuariicoccus sp. MJ-SS9]|uniref:c-type cytochrome n=1 Tax=Aestuariicoccus sp. MJ-SS9 TaxID=3079855 RepID=UPI0029143870|nr:cytochrome c family protein [Aestuariicoccus sp. MJ-SS9]MDU8911824.1 cytochrome c family protein [Aestuariicoccus sp. MJ-SS9]
MLDTMTFTKVVGGLCGSLLIFLLGKWAAESLYHVGGGHGEHAQAYVIETGEEDSGAAEEEVVDFGALLAAADLGDGEKVFGKCRACHKIDGTDATGPHLNGVVGRDIGASEGFAYSGALSEQADVWTPENLNAFLENPKGWAPGTTMGYAGLKKPEDRANLIAWLDSLDG